jgi:hypothetical protein
MSESQEFIQIRGNMDVPLREVINKQGTIRFQYPATFF